MARTDTLTFEDFDRLCFEQGVELAPEFVRIETPDPTDIDLVESHEPTSTLAAIARAGRILRRSPDRTLASSTIRPTKQVSQDVAASALIDIVNTSVDRTEPLAGEFSLVCGNMQNLAGCAMAENGFAHALNALKHPRNIGVFDTSEIIIDDDRKPLFLRKARGVVSALSIQSYVANGVRYPAGSLVRLEIDSDYREDGVVFPVPSCSDITVIPADAVTGVGFKRLSAFAFPGGQRHSFYDSLKKDFTNTHKNRRRRVIKWMDLNAMEQLLEQTVQTAFELA